MKKNWSFFLSFLWIIFISCNNSDGTPSNVIPQKKMQVVLWDIIRASTYTTNYLQKDTSKNAMYENAILQNKIFKLYNTDKETFTNSLKYYSSHSTIFNAMLDSMVALNLRQRALKTNAITAD